MNAFDKGSCLFLMAFAVFIGAVSVSELGIGHLELMGAGFMPFIAALLLFGLSLIALLSGVIRGRAQKGTSGRAKKTLALSDLSKPGMLVAALIVYAFFFKALGFPVMTFLLVYFLFVMMQPQKWKLDLVFAALVSALSFLLFDVWLRVSLPWGVLEWLR